jgi:hypothetical protein
LSIRSFPKRPALDEPATLRGRPPRIADSPSSHVNQLLEIESIGRAIEGVEYRIGPHEMINEARRRQLKVRAGLIEQLRTLLGVGDAAIPH